MIPLLTLDVHEALRTGARDGAATVECSLDLGRSLTQVEVNDTGWVWEGRRFPYLQACKDRTIYYWDGEAFQPVSRYTTSLIKLVPTEWGAPTFEIDGIKMLPTAKVSPYADAERKVNLIQPRGKRILDTCGGLGYFAAWCLRGQASQVLSFEKNADVIWLRSLNPWSPEGGPVSGPVNGQGNGQGNRPGNEPGNGPAPSSGPRSAVTLIQGDITGQIASQPSASFDAILHDPPRFGIAGELYSQVFYEQLARVLRRKGKLFHYTGAPNKLTTGRDVPGEVANRLQRAGFTTQLNGDGVLAVKK